MEIIGRDIEAGIGLEASRGVARTTAEKWFKKVNATIFPKFEYAVDDNSHGVLEESDNRRVTKKWIEGDLEGILHADAIGYILVNLLGSGAETTLDTGVYQHVYTVQQSIEHPSLSLFTKLGGIKQSVFNGAMVNSLNINASQNDFVRFSANFMAKEGVVNSDTPSYDTEYDFIAKDITIKMADTEAELAAASAISIKDLDITIEQGLIKDDVLGSYYPDDIYNSKFSIKGKFTKNYSDTVFEILAAGNSSKYMKITIEGEADLGGGNHPKLEFLLYKGMITNWEPGGANDELVTESIEFTGFYSDTDEAAVEVTLVNKTDEFDVASA
jgi:hypothetical protein